MREKSHNPYNPSKSSSAPAPGVSLCNDPPLRTIWFVNWNHFEHFPGSASAGIDHSAHSLFSWFMIPPDKGQSSRDHCALTQSEAGKSKIERWEPWAPRHLSTSTNSLHTNHLSAEPGQGRSSKLYCGRHWRARHSRRTERRDLSKFQGYFIQKEDYGRRCSHSQEIRLFYMG